MRIPPSAPPDVQAVLRELWEALDRLSGPRSVDLHGRRMLNAGGSQSGQEYVTRAQLTKELNAVIAQIPPATTTTEEPAPIVTNITGTHAERVAMSTAALAVDTIFYETDRTVYYVLAANKVWRYSSGRMVGLYAALPADLGADDVGFLFLATDTGSVEYRWSGTDWAATVPTSFSGTHAERLAMSTTGLTIASSFYETDRTVTYTLIVGLTWHYFAGTMVGLDSARPTDLGTADENFLYSATDSQAGYRWTGTTWVLTVQPPGPVPWPVDSDIQVDENNPTRWLKGAVPWKWHFIGYFKMFGDWLDAVDMTALYSWATGKTINGFRVFTMLWWDTGDGNPEDFKLDPADYDDADVDDFLTECETNGFYVELVCLATCVKFGYTLTQQKAHFARIAAIAANHPNVFVELANEPWHGTNQVDPQLFTRPAGAHSSKGTGTDGAPYVPQWGYLVDHPPRDTGWEAKAKHIREYTREGGAWGPPSNTPGVNDEPMGIDETASGSRTDDPQKVADFYAVADLYGAGGTIHSEALSIHGDIPVVGTYPVQDACIDAIAESWANIPPDCQLWGYSAGHLSTCPLEQTDELRVYAAISNTQAVCVIVSKGAGWSCIPRDDWIVETDGAGNPLLYGYGDNIVKLYRA